MDIQNFSFGDWIVTAIALFFVVLKATDGKLHHVPNPKFHLWYSRPQQGITPAQKRKVNIEVRCQQKTC